MQFQENFKFLNYQVIKRKNAGELPEDQRTFIKLNLLDIDNNPCSFMIFNVETIKKLEEVHLASLADISVVFQLTYNNNNWQVSMVSFISD